MTAYQHETRTIYLLLAECGPSGRMVRVGCSKHPSKRIAAHVDGSQLPLRTWAERPGSIADERRLHHTLRAHHSHSEWFHLTPFVERVLTRFVDGRLTPADLPEPKALPRRRKGFHAEAATA